jgi:hypothetical protein
MAFSALAIAFAGYIGFSKPFESNYLQLFNEGSLVLAGAFIFFFTEWLDTDAYF